MTKAFVATDYIPSREERAFKLALVEGDRGVSSYEIDRTIRIDVTSIGSRLVERLTQEGLIDRIYNFDRTKVYLLVGRKSATNFNSIPTLLRWIISPIQPSLVIPSFIHDWAVNEFDSRGMVVFKYDDSYLIARTGKTLNEIDTTSLFDLQFLVDKYLIPKNINPTFIKWTEAAEIYYGLAKAYRGKNNSVYSYLAYNAVRLAGFFKRIFGNTR